jgi:hypothetical protein
VFGATFLNFGLFEGACILQFSRSTDVGQSQQQGFTQLWVLEEVYRQRHSRRLGFFNFLESCEGSEVWGGNVCNFGFKAKLLDFDKGYRFTF